MNCFAPRSPAYWGRAYELTPPWLFNRDAIRTAREDIKQTNKKDGSPKQPMGKLSRLPPPDHLIGGGMIQDANLQTQMRMMADTGLLELGCRCLPCLHRPSRRPFDFRP